MNNPPQILIVEDEIIVAEEIRRSLQKLGYAVTSVVSSGEKAIEESETNPPDLVLMDIVLKGEMDGIEAAGQIHRRFNIPVVYLTAYSDEEIMERAKITEPFGYILKPYNERELHVNIEIALYKHNIEKQLRQSREWFSTTLNNLADAVIATDQKDLIIFMNPAARLLTGRDIMDSLGRPLKDVYEISEPSQNSGERGATGEIELTCMDGTKRSIEETRVPNKDEMGKINGSLIVFRDITERKKAEEMRIENESLMYANKIKSEFLAITSHDIRTPMTSIIGFSQLLKQKKTGELNPKQQHYVDNILSSSEFLLELINDILDISKIEAQKMELEIDQISLEESITEIFGIMRENAEKHNITMIKNIEPQLDIIWADERRFKQVLFNLLSNALKFSKEEGGTVTFSAKKEGNMVKFSVSDTGIGIREEELGKLFNKYKQLDYGYIRKNRGTGLGLVISKRLVELHGGEITVKSIYGQGSTFTFTIPIVPITIQNKI